MQHKYRLLLVFVLSLIAATPAFAADDVRSLLGSIHGPGKQIIKMLDQAEQEGTAGQEGREKIDRLVFDGRIPTTGRYRVGFRTRRWMDMGAAGDGSVFVFLQGQGEFRGENSKDAGDFPASATLAKQNGIYTMRIFINGDTEQRKRLTALYEIDVLVNADGSMQVTDLDRARWSSPDSNGRMCGNELKDMRRGPAPRELPVHIPRELAAASTLREVEVFAQMDTEWSAEFGSNGSSEIATILNGVETIYERDLGLTFTITIDPNPLTIASNDGEGVLEEYAQTTPSQSADLYHLFSAKDAGLFGIAYVAVVCVSPESSFGVTYHFNPTEDILTMAHEVGHSFGADHDDVTDPPTIMFSTDAANLVAEFSATSKAEIASFLAQDGSCLADTGSPAPEPTATPDPDVTPTPDDGGDLFETPDDPAGDPGPVDPDDGSFDSDSVQLDAYAERVDGTKILVVESYTDFDFVGSQQVEILYKRRKRQEFTVIESGTTDEFGAYVTLAVKGFYQARLVSNPGIVSPIVKVRRRF